MAAMYPQLCTIEAYTPGVDAHDQPIETWAAVSGYTNIPCNLSLTSGNELNGELQYSLNTYRLTLAGYYPSVTRLHRAVIDGQYYDILARNTDGFDNSVTVLIVKIADEGV